MTFVNDPQIRTLLLYPLARKIRARCRCSNYDMTVINFKSLIPRSSAELHSN